MFLKKVKMVVTTNYKSPISAYTLSVTMLNQKQVKYFPIFKAHQLHKIEDLFTPLPITHILIKL